MKIGNYTLDAREEEIILDIFERVKQNFPHSEISERESIIGIGEAGRFLFCYFLYEDGEVFVKFKRLRRLPLDASEEIQKNLEATVRLFNTEEMKRGSFRRESTDSANSAGEQPKTRDEALEELYLAYLEALSKLPQGRQKQGFDSCSARLKNALTRGGIHTVGDLLSLTPPEVMKIPNLGRKTFEELCSFLHKSAENEEAYTEISSNAAREIQGRVAKICYVNKKREPVCLKFDDTLSQFDEKSEEFESLYLELLDNVNGLGTAKLTPREYEILLLRLGVNEEAQSLQEIGVLYGFSRERIRQLQAKAMRKMLRKLTKNDTVLELECERQRIADKMLEFGADIFLYGVYTHSKSPRLVAFISDVYLQTDKEHSEILRTLRELREQKERTDFSLEKKRAFNERVLSLITFPERVRRITEADFARLKNDRVIPSDEKFCFEKDGVGYECDTGEQLSFLKKLLSNSTFAAIKTQSLKIPVEDSYFYSDFQCLAHDGRFVLIEVSSLLYMCTQRNVKKYYALREYCERYGFGYSVTDGRGGSFFDITEENEKFSSALLAEIQKNGYVDYQTYRKKYDETGAKIKNLLALIKKHDLNLSFPFLLCKSDKCPKS